MTFEHQGIVQRTAVKGVSEDVGPHLSTVHTAKNCTQPFLHEAFIKKDVSTKSAELSRQV